jgi:hypothetical protein
VTAGQWFFRVVASDDGRWTCRRGRDEVDSHDRLADALSHMTATAQASAPSCVYIHYSDGSVSKAAEFD